VRQGAENQAASFAALFGRTRALEGLNGTAAVAHRFEELSADATEPDRGAGSTGTISPLGNRSRSARDDASLRVAAGHGTAPGITWITRVCSASAAGRLCGSEAADSGSACGDRLRAVRAADISEKGTKHPWHSS
jgi:hypothetical protein